MLLANKVSANQQLGSVTPRSFPMIYSLAFEIVYKLFSFIYFYRITDEMYVSGLENKRCRVQVKIEQIRYGEKFTGIGIGRQKNILVF